LSIDANDTLQNISSEFSKFSRLLGLSDILVDRHGTEDEPPTYARGTARIDYVMATPGISQYVTAAGILPLKAISGSDHRPTFIDIDLTNFLGDQPFIQGEIAARSARTSPEQLKHTERNWKNSSMNPASSKKSQRQWRT
jgi:hypothetical protein